MGFLPPLCGLLMVGVLLLFSSHDVRDSALYTAFYALFGCAWVGTARLLSSALGIGYRDDVLERGNAGAAGSYGGALLGLTLCFSGANIGDGPGWWVVLICASLSTAAFFILWLFVEKANNVAEAVTVERDTAAGIRHGFFLLCIGAILGRAVAGDWVSMGATLADFASAGWPALLLTGIAIAVNFILRGSGGTERRSWLAAGAVPGIAYMGVTAVFLFIQGWWH